MFDIISVYTIEVFFMKSWCINVGEWLKELGLRRLGISLRGWMKAKSRDT